jgi:hypothetical protein
MWAVAPKGKKNTYIPTIYTSTLQNCGGETSWKPVTGKTKKIGLGYIKMDLMDACYIRR